MMQDGVVPDVPAERGSFATVPPMHACTIVAKNYLAQARVLTESFLAHNPDAHFTVLVIDEIEDYFDPKTERFTVLTPRDIDCEPFQRMAARYDVLELSTAVKPWLLRQQLSAGADTITYLDPDIQVFGPLNHLHDEACRHGLVLTPHNTQPIPDDGKKPTQIDIMVAGVYNLGYVSVGHGADIERLLDWWCERLARDCRVDPEYGYFVDQRWFDLAPGFVPDYSIIRDPEYNVAYWNAHSRELSFEDGQWRVDGRPLAFFHFSGFDPERPEVFSRHQTRLTLTEHPMLERICGDYAGVVRAQGYDEVRRWPYTYGRMASGELMGASLRALYAQGEDEGALTESPFTDSGCRALLDWAGQQDPDSPPGVNRALARVYSRRVDLRGAFPDLAGGSLPSFLAWAREHGPSELALPKELLPPEPSALNTTSAASPPPGPQAAPESRPPFGVNVIGYFRSELGVGEAARQAVSALDAVGAPLLPMHGATIPLSRQQHTFRYLTPDDARYAINLICMNADALPDFAAHAGPGFFADRYSIGLWFWEVAAAPPGEWRDAFALLDEVWAPTAHVAEVVRSVASIPVTQIRLPIEMPATSPLSRDALGIRDGFMFLFSFDYLSVFKRKNPLAVVDAFTRAFEPGEGATLVIKCINEDHDPVNHGRLLTAIKERPDIQVIDAYLDPWVKDALTATCDCYVSLHRSEGFGLTMAEAMYLGKPVIATAYSGNLDFMTAANSRLIDYTLVPIGDDAPPYPPGGMWAEPDVAQASAAMRRIYDDQDAARALGTAAAASIRETHSARAAGARMVGRLGWIHGHSELRAAARMVDRALRTTVERGPAPPPKSAAGRAGPALRRAVLRLVKPLSAYQQTVNKQLLETVESLDREIRRTTQAQQRSEAAEMAEGRRWLRGVTDLRHDLDELRALRRPIVERLDDLSGELQRLDYEHRALPYMADNSFAITSDPEAGKVQSYSNSGHVDDVYRSFEDVFRGSEEFIRERQRRYLPLLAGHDPVLDFGCGRGEMLDLLREAGIPYGGVDSDEGMIARCRAKGHDTAELDDGLAYLDRHAPDSLGAIFAAQVIEHLPYDALLTFLERARRALKPGGVLIAETVNPHSVPALKTFWVDLTHQHPIFPEVALALSRSANFERAFVFHPNGTGDIEVDRYRTGEYALVATKGDAAAVAQDPGAAPPPAR
jgi:glycosyltransferase involved in cell wall biosynthesis/SAM-dependent methyltransferase